MISVSEKLLWCASFLYKQVAKPVMTTVVILISETFHDVFGIQTWNTSYVSSITPMSQRGDF
jgi:hypothetical protein